jgi:hypothetical protein
VAAGLQFWFSCPFVPLSLCPLRRELVAERRERPIKIIASIGLGFVVLGVAGELCFEHWRAAYEGLLQNFDNTLFVEAQREADAAAAEAGELGVKVDTLPTFVSQKEQEVNGDIARFRKYADSVQGQTSDAVKRLETDRAALNKATDDAKAAARDAEAQRAAMAEANAPRYLSPQQQIDFVNQMKSFGNLAAQIVVPPSTTPDTGPLASLLESLLGQAGWKAKTMQPFGGWAKFVQVCPGPSPQPNVEGAAQAIVYALNQANVPSVINTACDPRGPEYGAGEPIKNADMLIVVGSKF